MRIMEYTLADYKTGEGSILRKGRDTYIVLTSSVDVEGWITKLQVFDTSNCIVIEVDPSFVDNLEYVGNSGFVNNLIKHARHLVHEHRLMSIGMGERIKLLETYNSMESEQQLLIKELESGVLTPTDYYKKLWLLLDKTVREYLLLED